MGSKVTLAVLGGFIIGGAVGFLYTRQVKKLAPSYVKTGFKNGIAYAEFDAKRTLANALPF